MAYLLCTDELIALLKPEGDDHPLIRFVSDKINQGLIFISVVSIGEVVDSISRISDFDQRQRAELNLDYITARLSNNIIDMGVREVKYWGTLRNTTAATDIFTEETMIIATAVENDLTLVCRGDERFDSIPVRTFDPY